MQDNWKEYKDWKELLESNKPRREEEESYHPDDDVGDLKEIFKEYLD